MFSERDIESSVNGGTTANELKPVTQEVTQKTMMMLLGK
jgi:hypothetical protein